MDLEKSNSRELTQLIIDKGVPANDASTQLLPYRLSNLSLRKSDLDHILDDLEYSARTWKEAEGYTTPFRTS